MIHTRSNKAYKGNIVNQALPSLHGGSQVCVDKHGIRNSKMQLMQPVIVPAKYQNDLNDEKFSLLL